MSGISILIPTYNGKKLLEKHLPAVLTASRDGDELVIIDDGSTDDSWAWLGKEFQADEISQEKFEGDIALGKWQHGKKAGPVQLLRNHINQRFAISCNRAVELATQPLIFLLNSDVSPYPDTIERLAAHFEDSSIFAVGCLEHEKNEAGKDVLGGKNELRFQRGMFIHSRAKNFTTGETAWASGGSSMFNRSKWLKLGGFDPEYAPAYWEDIDLSFRAKKYGWKILFDETAEVDHNHESTNTSEFGQKKMKIMSWAHSHTFFHKHATLWQKIQYFLWQPYWWIKVPYFSTQQLQLAFFLVILLLAVVTRGYKLGEVPHGMAWDEAAIGYNGQSVITTGRDEWLKKLPISFKSFGDFKAPLAIYINGIFTVVLGTNLFAIRLPFMLSSIVAIVGMMALTYLLWSEWENRKSLRTDKKVLDHAFPELTPVSAALLAGGLLTTSSWHIHYSRIGFESGMAMSFLLWGVVGLIWLFWRKLEAATWQKILVGIFSAGCMAASLYTYHSSKIVTPLIILVIAVLFRRKVLKHLPAVLSWCVLLACLLLPLGYDSVFGQGAQRFGQTSIFQKDSSVVHIFAVFVHNFAAHFSPSYLVAGETPTLRHGDGRWGVLYSTEVALGLAALFGTVFSFFSKRFKRSRNGIFLFAVTWIVVGILPAAIGIDVPHSNRALLALPGFILLSVVGWNEIATYWEKTLWTPAILGTLLMIHFFLFSSYLQGYFTVFAKESAAAFSDGYQEAIKYAVEHEDEVDKILITNVYQQPLIYTLLGRKTNVYSYHNGALIKYEFKDKVDVGDLSRPRALIIATPLEIDINIADKVIFGSDNKPRFVIVKTP